MKPGANLIYGALGVAGGLAGIMASTRCGSSGCDTCFGCASAGALIVAAALIKRKKTRTGEGTDHGMAQVGN